MRRHSLKSKIGKINEIKQKKKLLAHYLKKGLSVKEATVLADVDKKLLADFRSDPSFEDFLQKCEAQHEVEHLETINDAKTWQASAWMLERKYPDKYGKKDIVKHEYEIKFMTFQKVILEVINDADPRLKQMIMRKLRQIDLDNNPKLLENKSVDNSFIDVEMVED